MATALVIGASGFVGSHITASLLDRGTTVRGTTRDASDEKYSWLGELAASRRGSLSLHNLLLTEQGPDREQLLAAMADCSQVYFAAGVETRDPKTIDLMVNGILGVLEAAKELSVGVVVVTSPQGARTPRGSRAPRPRRRWFTSPTPRSKRSEGSGALPLRR